MGSQRSDVQAAGAPQKQGTREGVRLDKWLWVARFFKTRALAVRACELGRIVCHGHTCKPSREVHTGDRLEIRTEGGEFHVDVLGVSEVRGPAAVAQALYRETDESRVKRQQQAEERRVLMSQGLVTEHRPTGRDRRQLNRFRGRG